MICNKIIFLLAKMQKKGIHMVGVIWVNCILKGKIENGLESVCKRVCTDSPSGRKEKQNKQKKKIKKNLKLSRPKSRR